jgi:hypothetical protein
MALLTRTYYLIIVSILYFYPHITCQDRYFSFTQDAITLKHPSFSVWKKWCNALPLAYEKKDRMSLALTQENMIELLEVFDRHSENELKDISWVNNLGLSDLFFVKDRATYCPHVQKLVLEPGSTVAVHGDIHGDIHSLVAFIDHLKSSNQVNDFFNITDDSLHMLFLGDYTDRGAYGAEVIYTLLRLKIQNPDKVFLVRGNHEDIAQNNGDFADEIFQKFKKDAVKIKLKINGIYQRLPVAVYLGAGQNPDYALCCHGGIEWGYDPEFLLAMPRKRAAQIIPFLNRVKNLENHPAIQRAVINELHKFPNHEHEYQDCINPKSPQHSVTNGFMWFDFNLKNDKNDELFISFDPKRSWRLGQQITQQLMAKNNIKTIFRAHQHGDARMMKKILATDKPESYADKGVGVLWNSNRTQGHIKEGSVFTFSVSPHNGYGKKYSYQCDFFGLLQIAESINDWRLDMKKIEVTEYQQNEPN